MFIAITDTLPTTKDPEDPSIAPKPPPTPPRTAIDAKIIMAAHHTEAMSNSTEGKPHPQDERDRPRWLNVPRQDLAYSMDCLIPGLYLWLALAV